MAVAAPRLTPLLEPSDFSMSYTTAHSEPDHHRSYYDEGSTGSTALEMSPHDPHNACENPSC
jgi:hypothetical protein